MGAFLTAVNDVLRDWFVDDIRNLNYEGRESPPTYEVVQLNSTKSSDFLVDGIRFIRQPAPPEQRASLRVEPRWYGLDVTTYGLRASGAAERLLASIQQRSRELNFLKGEAFALSGEFLPKTDETFADLFLEEKNAAAMTRVVTLINTRGKDLENRGVLLMGPPGTGKTLAARIVRNDAKATFIWVSSRDFHYSGSFGGFSQAFDLARECAPSVVVFEDIDNWLYETTVDLIKTEMDGVARSSGVVTMMTTNYPEQLPSALIDRPGRFHDVLRFDLPDDVARTKMLSRWLPSLSESDRSRAVKATAGYSGAHVRELARFAQIIADQDALPLGDALTSALTKLAEQRDLITATQRSGSRYRMAPNLTQKSSPVVHRAFSLVDIKAFDAQKRTFSGIATSPKPDRVGDVIEADGVTFTNPLPLLLYHDNRKPVGETVFGRPNSKGIPFDALISSIDRPGAVKDRLDEAIDSLSAKPPLIRGVSIGFRELEPPVFIKETGGYRYPKVEVVELSMVVIPMHQDATIDNLRSIAKSFHAGRAAIGTTASVPDSITPGASGTRRVTETRTGRTMKKSISDQIAAFEATRQAKAARMDEIVLKDDGTTPDEAEAQEYDDLEAEVRTIDAHLVRLRAAEKRSKETAKPAIGDTPERASESRGHVHVQVRERALPGTMFARYAMCMANSRGIPGEAIRLAKEHYPNCPGVLQLVEKTAVAGGATSGSHWLDDMVPYNIMQDFIEFLRPGSIIGKFGTPIPGIPGRSYPSLRKAGFNERVSGMSTGFTAGWKGEGLPALPSAAVTFNQSLTWNCMAALAVLTKEAIRFSNPNAEIQVRDDLARAVNGKLDLDFVDPAKASSGTTSPASITYGVAATPPSGTAATNLRHDLAVILALFATNNLDPSDIVLIMSGTMASNVSMMVNALGQPDFPLMSDAGGILAGKPVIVSEHLTAVGSPSTQTIIAVKASDVYLADDGVVTVEASDQASIEMVDTSSQSGLTGTGASLVSLWQAGLVGLMANREITWKKRRSTAVQYISPAAYAVPTS